jgi:hypothetical protein
VVVLQFYVSHLGIKDGSIADDDDLRVGQIADV